MATLLKIEDLRTHFFTSAGTVKAVDGISYDVEEGETVALVGESGCGKSVSALSILRLIPDPPGRIVGGGIRFKGTDILALDEKAIGDLRGRQISMVFQEPMTSLNPVLTIGLQLTETMTHHLGMNSGEARARAAELLKMVGLSDAERRLNQYPHQLSGGMRHRVMIAMALSCEPALIIADEPTTALDVTIQAQILDLLLGLQREHGMALILITHDMAVVAETAGRVSVMYAGQQVEERGVDRLFAAPRHPYTAALLDALPERSLGHRRLPTIPGVVPGAGDRPGGCLFNPRCRHASERCREERPGLEPDLGGRLRCYHPLEGGRPTGVTGGDEATA